MVPYDYLITCIITHTISNTYSQTHNRGQKETRTLSICTWPVYINIVTNVCQYCPFNSQNTENVPLKESKHSFIIINPRNKTFLLLYNFEILPILCISYWSPMRPWFSQWNCRLRRRRRLCKCQLHDLLHKNRLFN